MYIKFLPEVTENHGH